MPRIPNPDTHFADLVGQYAVLDTLPDPDVILAKAGIGVPQLRNIFNDAQVETVWSSRLAGVTGVKFTIEPGDTSTGAGAAADRIAEMVSGYDFTRIITAMMEAVAFGFCPIEIIWNRTPKAWHPVEFVPKPPEWFFFSPARELMFRARSSFRGIPVPDRKFILTQNRPSYANPYGSKLFSKIFWPVTFKRNGLRWWTQFIEKFGAPFVYGKLPRNSTQEDREALLDALADMLANSVAVGPDESYVEIKGDMIRSQSGQVHQQFYDAQNAEIAKAVLGQTLTSDIGKDGSRAAAEVHYKVKGDIAKADQRLIASGFDQLFTLVTRLNFGPDTPPPRFTYEKMKPLHAERAERDKRLHDMGVRFNAEYFATHYKIDPTQIEVQNPAPSFTTVGRDRHFSRRQTNETVADFTARLERAGQDTIDDIIDDFQAEIDKAKSFEDAANRILNRYQRQFKHRSKLAEILDNLRYVAASAGASNAKE